MAYASIATFLSLDRYARIMNINPVNFNGATQIDLSSGATLFPQVNNMNNIWPQYAWQSNDQLSIEELAHEIWIAEQDIISEIGCLPCPGWIEDEAYAFETHYRPEISGFPVNPKALDPTLTLRHGRFIASGRRAVQMAGLRSVVVTYSDADSDGFYETATVVAAAPTGAVLKEMKVYFEGHNGDREWEIREPRTTSLVAGSFTATFWTWQMIKPSTKEALPTNATVAVAIPAVNLNTFPSADLVANVDVYREYNDFTQPGAIFKTNEVGVIPSETDGYLYTQDPAGDIVVPIQADYDVIAGQWGESNACDLYQYVNLWYYSGYVDPKYKPRIVQDMLSDSLAKAIAYMATARTERIFMSNNNAVSLAVALRNDYAIMTRGANRYVNPDLLNNPFGTRKGEYDAWNIVKNFKKTFRIGNNLI